MPIKILFSILIIISCSCVEESETSDDVSEFSFKSENTPFEALQVLDIHFRSHKPAQPILVSAQNDRLFVFDKEDNSLKEYGFTNSTFIFRKSLLSIASDDRANRLTSSKNGLVLSTSSCIYVVLNDGIINKYDNSYGIYGMALNDNNTALYVYNYNGVPKETKKQPILRL